MLLLIAAATVLRVSVATDGTPGNNSSILPAISGDGRYVVFQSSASNLVARDTNEVDDVFLRDLEHGTTECLTCAGHTPAGWPAISPNGRYVSYYRVGAGGIVLDRLTGVETNVGPWVGCVSPRFVATGDTAQSFVRDLRSGATIQVTRAPAGTVTDIQALSRTGRFVVYGSVDWNQSPYLEWHTHLLDLETGYLEQVDDGSGWGPGTAAISADGRFVCTSPWEDVILYDRTLGTTTTLAVGAQRPVMTPDARYVAWQIDRIQILDRRRGALETGPIGWNPTISDNGTRVAFVSNEIPNPYEDVYVLFR